MHNVFHEIFALLVCRNFNLLCTKVNLALILLPMNFLKYFLKFLYPNPEDS